MQTYSLAVSFCRAFRSIPSLFRYLVCAVLASALPSLAFAENTIVRIEVAYGGVNGNIDIELYDDLAPKTVMNFLNYAGRGDYTTNGLFHFAALGQAIRGGGITYAESSGIPIFFHIPEDPPIPDEVSPPLINSRGTIAMFKPINDVERVTSEWTINLADNFNSINNVFGQVIAGMGVADAIGALPKYVATNTHSAFISIPLVNFDNTGPILAENLVRVLRIPNVRSTRTIWGTLATFTADVDLIFTSVSTFNVVDTETLLSTFTPPPNTSAYHSSGILTFKMTGSMDLAGEVVTLRHGSSTSPDHYYAYGPTPDDPTDHWYDFTYDGVTGAEIAGDKIRLHFVDGQRGDYDLAMNNEIPHIGAPTLITENDTEKLSGCAIANSPSPASSHGDWIIVSMFLIFLGLLRRRVRRRISLPAQRGRVTNITSP